ncbi:hypothetical protein [Oligoflexus tunisiensis]|uniref:hypothetical protein n=1 Tax=Oligoflexus tunisiensis TaxID=708132 RepID=UPI00114C9A6C|nr:hypothetical protein [Oligoflexus tunisiensis]
MKYLILLSAFFMASVAAARPIAYLKQSGGFCPGTCPSASITVEDNGTVFVEIQKYVPTPSVERRVLLRMGRELVSAMRRDINSIQIAKLVDMDEGQPFCADIPELLYTVVQGNQKIDIGIDRDCHKFRMANFHGTQIVSMLQSFLDMHYYAAP